MIAQTPDAELPPRTHNQPPDPIDAALEPHADYIEEAGNWLDGEPVQNADQLKALDALLKQIKAAAKDVKTAREAETKPLHDAWKAEVARWKPVEDDLERIRKGLAKAGEDFRRKLADQKEAEKRAAYEEARRKQEAADAAARAANAANIEEQRKAAELKHEAQQAKAAASATAKDKVTGLRTVHRYEITDKRAALQWVLRNDPDAVTEWLDGYVKRHFREAAIDGVTVTQDKEAW